MTPNDPVNHHVTNGQDVYGTPGKTVDLQGVAAFVGLVELLAQELGTTPGRIQGHLPNGPATFEELAGEIVMDGQGYHRSLMLLARLGLPLKVLFQCQWRDAQRSDSDGISGGVQAQVVLDATVEQILPQGRALARYAEDMFAVLDRMVTLGQANKLSSLSVSASEIEAFELGHTGNLVNNTLKRAETFNP